MVVFLQDFEYIFKHANFLLRSLLIRFISVPLYMFLAAVKILSSLSTLSNEHVDEALLRFILAELP